MASVSNILAITPDEAIELLKWKSKNRETRISTTMFQGKPGVGKTSMVTEFSRWRLRDAKARGDTRITEEMIADPVKHGMLRMVILNSMDPADVGGMRFLNHDDKTTITYRPNWMPTETEDLPIVIFVDELTTVEKFLQAPMYSVLQERRLNDIHMHDNVMIVAAGNGPEHGAISHELSSAVVNRMSVMDVDLTATAWLKWATRSGIHAAVCAHLQLEPTQLENCKEAVDQGLLVFKSPRSWEAVSRICYAAEENAVPASLLRAEIAGRIGREGAATFYALYEQRSILANLDEMLKCPRKDIKSHMPQAADEHTLGKLTMLSFSLANVSTPENCVRVLEIFLEMYKLKIGISTKDMATAGAERFFEKHGTNTKVLDALLASDAYKEYAGMRNEQGLHGTY